MSSFKSNENIHNKEDGSYYIAYLVTAYSLCGSGTVEFQVTEYSRCGILVPYAMVRKTRERRAAGPWVKAILVVLLFTGSGTYWDFFCFLRYYQAVTNQLTYGRDRTLDKHHGQMPLELSYLQGQHAEPKASFQLCKRVLGSGPDQYYPESLR